MNRSWQSKIKGEQTCSEQSQCEIKDNGGNSINLTGIGDRTSKVAEHIKPKSIADGVMIPGRPAGVENHRKRRKNYKLYCPDRSDKPTMQKFFFNLSLGHSAPPVHYVTHDR